MIRRIIRKLKNIESEDLKKNENTLLFENMLSDAKEILSNTNSGNDSVHPIFIFIKQITDYITLENGIYSLLNKENVEVRQIQNLWELGGEQLGVDGIKKVILEKPHPADLHAFRNYFFQETDVILDLASIPIILFPWKSKRTVSAIQKIGTIDNEFNCKKYQYNIQNIYYYPIGVAICEGGNHSQYSAKLKGKGETCIEQINDIQQLYKTNSFVPNQYMNKHEVYIGILFEIGRLLLDYEEIFPTKIISSLHNSEKITF